MYDVLSTLGQIRVEPRERLIKNQGDCAICNLISGQIVGERGGTAFPFRFWRGNAVPLAYTMAATYNTSNRKIYALNA